MKQKIIKSDNKKTPKEVAALARKGISSCELKTKVRTSKHIIEKELNENSITPWVKPMSEEERRDYYWYFDFKQRPISEKALEALAVVLIKWAKDETIQAFKLCDFYHKYNIRREVFYRWRKKCPALNAAANIAIEVIGSRREFGSATRKYDSGTIMKTLGMYDLDYKAFLVWLSKLDVSEERRNELFQVYMNNLSGVEMKKDEVIETKNEEKK